MTAATGLTPAQVAAFGRDGFLHVPGLLTAHDLAPVIGEIEAWIDRRARRLLDTGRIADAAEGKPFHQRYATLYAQSPDIAAFLDVMFMQGEAFFALLHHPALLDAVESIVGPEITCNPIQHLRAKPPTALEGDGSPSFHVVPWHQDAGVMMAEAEGSDIVSCWIPLVDVAHEMGALRVLPGVAASGYLHHVSRGETMIDATVLPTVEAETIECRLGDVIFLHRFTPHSSTPNHSDRCRWSLDVRFQPTGQHTGRTGHPDFVVRSPTGDAGLIDHAEWCRRWNDAFERPRGYVGHRQDIG